MAHRFDVAEALIEQRGTRPAAGTGSAGPPRLASTASRLPPRPWRTRSWSPKDAARDGKSFDPATGLPVGPSAPAEAICHQHGRVYA